MQVGDLVEWKHNASNFGIILKKELGKKFKYRRQQEEVYIYWFHANKCGWQHSADSNLRVVSSCRL